ncbi:MAG: potassium-transporting ATPase subunit C, partial [Angelakisella sp.]
MKSIRDIFPKAFRMLLSFTVLCGILYTLAITVVAQLIFPYEADGSIIEVNGKRYGSELIGQQFTGDGHLWGRIMKLDTQTFTDSDGKALLYAVPANLSPASEEYEALVAERVERIRSAHPDRDGVPIPVDLVTCSGSGLDPHISVAAA